MFLKKIILKNFRGITELSLPLDDLCVLIGENNSGKSSILDAIRICLTRSLSRRGAIFDDYDYHLEDIRSEPAKAKTIEITLNFAERKKDEWPNQVSQLLTGAEQVDADGLRSVTLCVKSGYDTAIGDFATTYDFLDLGGNALVGARNPRILLNFQQLIPTFYLASLRDAAQEFRPRSQFWGPFVKALNLDEKARASLEQALRDLNKQVLDQHASFEKVKDRLKKAAEILPLGSTDPVSIEAVPTKVFDILSRTQVSLASKTGAHIPLMKHGHGTQSLAVICLFDAFLQSQLEGSYGKNAEPLLALEEPEAHLHPSAVKAVGEMLIHLTGQKIISTHSGDLLACVPLKNIRRLRRKDGKISVYSVVDDALTSDELHKLDYQVRASRGSLLFSRCWLLVEGETEGRLMAECARVLGYDLYTEGVSAIEFTQIGLDKFIKLADQLGIEWIVLADGDNEGKKYANTAEACLNGRLKLDHIRLLDQDDMEIFLCMNGFGHIYEANITEQKKKNVIAKPGTLDYWVQVTKAQSKHSKPRNSQEVTEEMVRNGKDSVPVFIKNLIEQAIALAGTAK